MANLWKVVRTTKKISKKNIKKPYFKQYSRILVPFYARKCVFLQRETRGKADANRPNKRIYKTFKDNNTMRQLPPITKNLLIINLLFFLASFALPRHGVDLESLMGLHYFEAPDFHPYQFFTYMFMHAGLEHIFFNMFALWMFGRIVESTLGSKRFLILYVVCGLGAGLLQELAQYAYYSQYEIIDHFHDISTGELVTGKFFLIGRSALDLNLLSTVGASGAVYGVLLAFGMLYPNDKMFIIPIPVPIKAKYLIAGYAIIELLSAINGANDNVAHIAHLGGMLFAAALIIWWKNRDRRNNDYWGGGYYNTRY